MAGGSSYRTVLFSLLGISTIYEISTELVNQNACVISLVHPFTVTEPLLSIGLTTFSQIRGVNLPYLSGHKTGFVPLEGIQITKSVL